ncbi:MAG: 50S ribosomal protein L25 [Patescibacteria group bacterium]
MISLSIEKRDIKTKLDEIRNAGRIPAVYYGPQEESTPITVSAIDFKKVWKKAGESSVVLLKDASGNEYETLIHELDVHPLTGAIRHADFYVFEKGKKLQVAVQLNFVGVAPAVKDKGAILVKVRREIEIEAAPKDLPHELEVDISKLVELTDTVQAKDIKLPSGVELKISPEEVIASIAEAKEEVEELPTAPDLSAIEVEAKGKEVKEGEEGAAAPAGKDAGDKGDKK